MNLQRNFVAVQAAVVWLFLLQALRTLFASLFGVIYDAIFDVTLSPIVVGLDLALLILAVLTPLLLGRFRDQASQARLRLFAALLVLVARLLISFPSPTLRLYASIVLLGAAAFYVAHLLWHTPERLMNGFLLGLVADQLLRALDYTYDPTLRPGGLPLVIGLVVVAGAISLYLARRPISTAPRQPHWQVGLALGAALFVQTSLLALPNALSRWSSLGYGWTAPLLLLVTLLPLGSLPRAVEMYLAIWFWPMGGIVSILLALSLLALAAMTGGLLAAFLLLLLQMLFLFNFTTGVVRRFAPEDAMTRSPGLAVSLGFLLLLLLNFAFAFTFTYPYTLPFFRGLGTLVLLVGVLLALLPVARARIEPETSGVDRGKLAFNLGGMAILFLLCFGFTRSPSLIDTPPDRTLRLATFNIHYGFDSDWVFNLEGMAEAIEASGADIVALQEVDAGRITSLSVDDALWLGQRLGMRVVYQPTLEKLSGVALLSRYPLEATGGRWLKSDLEQTAIVYGAVETQRGPLYAYGLWLGLEPDERAAQLAQALDYVGQENPAALGGDFNATPDSPVYAYLQSEGWVDPFVSTDSPPVSTSPATNPQERIDYVWLRGLAARRAWVSDSTASDHRMVVVEVEIVD